MNKINTIEVLTKEEIALAEEYIRHYAYNSAVVDETKKRPFVDILDEQWAIKKHHFYKAFGDKLILSKKIKVGKSQEQLETEIDERRATPGNPIDVFYNNLYDYFARTMRNESVVYRGWSYNSVVEWAYYNLASYSELVKNVVPDGDVIVVPADETHKEFKIQPGCKVIKALGKIAERYGIEGFEEFRLEHSRVLNTPLSEEELCVSIHPLDFITMSENDCNWQSCMNWKNTGCYRMGTVEMMNSPIVVVAYLKSENDMTRFGYKWNNKKWRQLFIVVNEAIIGIKAYPYRSESASKEVIKMLAEAFSNNDYDMSNCGTYEWDCGIFYNDNHPYSKGIGIDLETDTMYNDFGTTFHDIVFSKTYYQSFLDHTNDNLYYNYSGLDQCMLTGKSVRADWYTECPDDDEVPAERLICVSCEPPRSVCGICGTHYYLAEEIILDDGTCCCPFCAEHRVVRDIISGETCSPENADLITVRMVPGRYDPNLSWYYVGVKTNRANLQNGKWNAVFPEVQARRSTPWATTWWVSIDDCSGYARELLEEYISNHYSSLEDYVSFVRSQMLS